MLPVIGDTMTFGVPQAYDALNMVIGLLGEVGPDSEKLKDALYNADYDGVSGHIQFDQNGDLKEAKYDVKIVRDGKTEKFE
jgi:ABC-type branched-subunit amino acid transport system substrate-binding protein